MAEIYVAWIVAEKKKFSDVPALLKGKVKELLATLGLDENGKPEI